MAGECGFTDAHSALDGVKELLDLSARFTLVGLSALVMVSLAGVRTSAQQADSGQLNNLNQIDSLCLELRNVATTDGLGACQADDAQCPSDSQCIDDNTDPLDGGVCVSQACVGVGEAVTVDIELGPTGDPACGAQVFLAWDVSALSFVNMEVDPDNEFGSPAPIVNIVDAANGTMDLVVSLISSFPCNDATGAFGGGTIARLTLLADGACDASGSVWFREHAPPTSVGSAFGAMNLIGCNGDATPSGSGTIAQAEFPVWECPSSSTGHAFCGTILREVALSPIRVTDACDGTSAEGLEVCEVKYFPPCEEDLDCGRGDFCAGGQDCGDGECVPDPEAVGFPCPGGQPCIGFCRVAACVNGICDEPVTPAGVDIQSFAEGGGSFLPGLTKISCSYANSCGLSSSCEVAIGNSGMNALRVAVDLSPTMNPGFADNPIERCIEFELSDCGGAASESYFVSSEVVFGAPLNVAGSGTTTVEVPPANWFCVSANDPKHSLISACPLVCDADGAFVASFRTPMSIDPYCHLLVQGNMNNDEFVDIVDFTLFAAEYFTVPGEDSPCGVEGTHADINGDSLVTLSDFQFIVFNFMSGSGARCDNVCNPPSPAPKPMAEASSRELRALGLGAYVDAADVNKDGKVDAKDVADFLEMNADEDPVLADSLRLEIRRRVLQRRQR